MRKVLATRAGPETPSTPRMSTAAGWPSRPQDHRAAAGELEGVVQEVKKHLLELTGVDAEGNPLCTPLDDTPLSAG